MKQILLTCDTEIGELSRDVEGAFDLFVCGRVGGEEVGVPLINAVAKEYGATVNHFVDIYPPRYEREFAQLCEEILSAGHFVGLHTHPSTRYGKRYMHEYTAEEQKRIIAWGKEWFQQHLGLDVRAHRAGGYGADTHIYEILRANGIPMDSSFFYRAPQCKMDYPHINRPALHGGVYEVPVTVYLEKSVFLGRELRRRQAVKKLDFRYGSDSKAILEVIRRVPRDSIIVLFLHSFNFMEFTYHIKTGTYTDFRVHRRLIEEYHALLDGIRAMGDTVFIDFDRLYMGQEASADFCVEVKRPLDLCGAVWQRIETRILGRTMT